jgi:hypothetical protein
MEQKLYKMIPFGKSFNVKLIDKYIDKALIGLRAHYNTTPTGKDFDKLITDWWDVFGQKFDYQVLYKSLLSLVNTEITRNVVKTNTWRLAGNLDKLKRGIAVPAYTTQSNHEWVSVKIVRGQLSRSYRGKLGYTFDYRVHNGQPAGLRFKLFWSLRYMQFIAKSCGLKRGRKIDYHLVDGTELVGMRLYLLLDPELNKEDGPGNYHFHVPPACKAANRKILKQRKRQIACPEGYALSEMPCYKCPFGYDQCPAACHPFTHTVKACPRCLEKEAWFDPASKGVICIDCEEAEITGTKEE